jgi:hypothetical protein
VLAEIDWRLDDSIRHRDGVERVGVRRIEPEMFVTGGAGETLG